MEGEFINPLISEAGGPNMVATGVETHTHEELVHIYDHIYITHRVRGGPEKTSSTSHDGYPGA